MGKIIGLVVGVVLIIGGVLVWKNQSKESVTVTKSESPLAAVTEAVPAEEKGVVSSIKEAMGLGKKMQCTYAMDQNGKTFESTVVVDGSKFQSATAIGARVVYALFDGTDQYTWMSGQKTGMKMSKACLEKLGQTAKDMPKSDNAEASTEPQDMQKAFDFAKNVQCSAKVELELTVPEDVSFTDQCALMEQSAQMMKEVKDKLPAGMSVPGMPAAY